MKIITRQSLFAVREYFLGRHSKNRITWSENVMILRFFIKLQKISGKIVKINNAAAPHIGIPFIQLSSTKGISILKFC